ncbi:hypothetical protein O3M35_007246 [Rhynocoris fuscipes]|uniref:Uncharacterized protein n=1 Tax=Rhynocoris fuscipes TaxID=488301 RepID=A0AAW1D8U2_9HEMI
MSRIGVQIDPLCPSDSGSTADANHIILECNRYKTTQTDTNYGKQQSIPNVHFQPISKPYLLTIETEYISTFMNI